MTNIWHIFDVMTNLLMRWQTFWRDDVLLTSWRTFWSNDEPFVLMTYFDIMTNILKSGQTDFLKSWRVYDIITNLWRHIKHNVSNIFDVMVNVLALWKFLMTWHTIWCHDTLFDVMTNFLTSWCVLCFKANVVLSWRIPWPAYIVLAFFVIILGTKYYENVSLMSLTLWYIFYFMVDVWRHDKPFVIMPCFWWTFWRHGKFVDVMICFWHHDVNKFVDVMACFWHHSKFVDAMTCFWLHSITFWSMLHLLTSWRTFWCHGSFDDMTHFLCPDARHVFYIMTNLFVVMTYVRHYFGNKI